MLKKTLKIIKTLTTQKRVFFSSITIETSESEIQKKNQSENNRIDKLLEIPEIIDLDAKSYFLGNLIICPTPLGNLQDLSIRGYHALQEADIIVCEDTRVTGKLFKMLRIKDFEKNLRDIMEEEIPENDDFIMEEFKNKTKVEHSNMLGVKRLKKKTLDYLQKNDVKEAKKLADKKLVDIDTLGFLKKYEEKDYEGENFYDDEFTYDTSAKNRKKTGAKNLYGIESEFVNFIKKKIYESKLKNKRGLLLSSNRFTELEKVFDILRLIKAGLKVILVTDAGTPCLSDPGQVLVNESIKHNILIHSLPGPNAISISIVASGFPADQYAFLGYLDKIEKNIISTLEKAKEDKKTFVIFENKNRLLKTLLYLEKYFGKNQMIYIGVELTKLHERHLRGTISNVYEKLNKNPDYTIPSLKGELTLVIAPHIDTFNKELRSKSYQEEILEEKKKIIYDVKIEDVIRDLNDSLEIGQNDLSVLVSKILKIKKNRAYNIIKQMKNEKRL